RPLAAALRNFAGRAGVAPRGRVAGRRRRGLRHLRSARSARRSGHRRAPGRLARGTIWVDSIAPRPGRGQRRTGRELTMKGVPGLMIALALGIVGAFCNWVYLAQKGAELERVDFIVIEEQTKINPGDKFREEHFRKLSIPRIATDQLEKAAPRWEE